MFSSVLTLFAIFCFTSLIFHSESISCNNITDCSYNGICSNNKCECFPQWKGNHCATLNIIPGSINDGLHSFVNNSITSTWGGSVVKDKNGIYHMIASEMTNNCGIQTWLSNSQIVHALSTNGSIGTYQRVSINPIQGIFSHEPCITKANNNEYVIYFTNAYPPITNKYPCLKCTNGSTNKHECNFYVNYTNGLPLIQTKMIYSSDESFNNWSNMINIETPTPWLDSNLDCHIYTNQSVTCLGRSAVNGSDYSGYFILKADNWKDNSTYFNINITDNISKLKGIHCCGEDPTIYYDSRYNVLHAIWHYNNETNFNYPLGIHTFSIDGGYHWNAYLDFNEYTPEYAYGSYVEYTDANSHNFTRCERPKLIMADDGYTILALTNGVQPSKENDYTFTLLRPVNQNITYSR